MREGGELTSSETSPCLATSFPSSSPVAASTEPEARGWEKSTRPSLATICLMRAEEANANPNRMPALLDQYWYTWFTICTAQKRAMCHAFLSTVTRRTVTLRTAKSLPDQYWCTWLTICTAQPRALISQHKDSDTPHTVESVPFSTVKHTAW